MTKKFPPEFASEWHYERHIEDLGRELAGREARLAELKSSLTTENVLELAENEVAAARAELERFAGKKRTSKRPAGKDAETR